MTAMKKMMMIGLASCLAASPVFAVPDRFKPMPSVSNETFYQIIENLQRNPPRLSASRLPDGFKIGRCLFEVRGRKLIDGPCSYMFEDNRGGYTMHGPHQVFSGIDYPEPECYCQEISTDWSVRVAPDLDDNGKRTGVWGISWGGSKEATHLQGDLGDGVRKGACVVTKSGKACLWKE
jgi:hypothetical protein